MTNNEFVEGEEVYVSNVSVEHALKCKEKRIYLHTAPGNTNSKYICVRRSYEEEYKNGKLYNTITHKYIAKIPKEDKTS